MWLVMEPKVVRHAKVMGQAASTAEQDMLGQLQTIAISVLVKKARQPIRQTWLEKVLRAVEPHAQQNLGARLARATDQPASTVELDGFGTEQVVRNARCVETRKERQSILSTNLRRCRRPTRLLPAQPTVEQAVTSALELPPHASTAEQATSGEVHSTAFCAVQ